MEHVNVSTDELLAGNIINNAAVALTEEEQARRNLLEDVMACRISVTDEYPPEECLLSVGGVEFFAKGDIHAIKAKQKQGKTNAISLMVATLLSGKWGPLTAVKENARVLVIDTEQKAADTQLIYNRTLQLAGLPKEDIFERFQTMPVSMLPALGRCASALLFRPYVLKRAASTVPTSTRSCAAP